MIGQTISHYKITAKLGEGGMGVVYRAEDTKLDRTVALKFIAANLIKDAEARKRFEREAKAAAGVSHANVCHVYEIADADGHTFLAMEFVEGEGLDKRIELGPLPFKDALDLASQAAKGLSAAHARRVVHRDIKPANLLVSDEGELKILDFGLALLTEGSKLTQLDTKVGTVAYMSPEQAEGMEVDHRSDIWSLGCVLYEMVCGQRPFRGAYDQALLYEIINQEAEPLTGIRSGVPMELEWIVGKCLAKDADSRYQNAADLTVDLKNLQDKLKSGRSTILRTSLAPGVPAVTTLAQPQQPGAAAITPNQADGIFPLNRKLRWLQGFLALSVLAALVLAFVHFREAPPEIPLTELTVDLPAGAQLHTFSLSPDGRHVALALGYNERERRLWVRSLDSLELRELAGTEGARYPFWSPDSRYIGFFADGKLKKVALPGGPPQSLCDAQDGRGGSWNAEGSIVFTPSPFGPIHRAPEGGGKPVALTTEADATAAHRFPSFLPDGHHFFYAVNNTEPGQVGIYLGSIDGAEPRRILPDPSNAIYARPAGGDGGVILFTRENILMAQPFDTASLNVKGDAIAVADSISRLANGINGFSASTEGALLYTRGGERWGQFELSWMDRSGKKLGTPGKPSRLGDFSLSPDDKRVALSIGDSRGSAEIWLLEFARGTMSRLSSSSGSYFSACWSPDGRQIAFSSRSAGGLYGIHLQDSSGATKEKTLLSTADSAAIGRTIWVSDWSRDGRYLLFYVQRPQGLGGIWVLPLEGDRKPYPFLKSQAQEYDGRFSPDDRWVSYTSGESGRPEVYVRPFPAADRKWQISIEGGTAAVWNRNGRELYYVDLSGKLMTVTLPTGDPSQVSAPKELFQTGLTGGPNFADGRYAVSKDGRFLVATQVGEEQQGEGQKLVMISDWRAKVGK